ncbi:MAG: CotH kinase family protein, partial [Planctomycetes bacterium]|nr:CotH kinase family protein [Planctomycetota bacterium]
VSLVDVNAPGTNLIPNGGFDQGISPWVGVGNHVTSRWSAGPEEPVFEVAALHLISTGTGTGSANSVRVDTTQSLDTSGATRYRLTFSFLPVVGSNALVGRLSSSSASTGLYWELGGVGADTVSPGVRNRAAHEAVPPFVSHISRIPRAPFSNEAVAIAARIRGEPIEVKIIANLKEGSQEFAMRDDGASGDALAGDGIYGAELPAQPHGTAVTYRIEARSAAGTRVFPSRTDPQGYYGYYVCDDQPPSVLPVYTLIVPGDPVGFSRSLSCSTYTRCSFAFEGELYPDIEIRARGQSACGASKRYMKLKFHRGHEFQGSRRLNLQSLWTDKSLIREHMAWEMFDRMSEPYCFHRFIRLHANGAYFGLYAEMEHPDARYLTRNGLNSDGNLYKATASREERDGTYEKKTNEHEGDADLRAFLNALHDTPASGLVSFFQQNVDEDSIIEYQASHVLANNRDYPHKNHYLYHDTATGKWIATAWDVDLTFGKRWDGSYGGIYHDKMDNPGATPWQTTTVNGGGLGNYLLDKFFAQAGTWYRRAYLVRLWSAIQEKYTIEDYDGRIAALSDLLWDEQFEDIAKWGRTAATADDPTAPAEFEPNLERVREHIRLRRTYLLNYLRTTDGFSGHDRLKITEVMYNPPGLEEGEFLELWNNTGKAIDISGWTIDGLEEVTIDGERTDFRFPAGTTVADDEVFIVAKDPRIFRGLSGYAGRVFGPYPGNLDNGGETLRVRDDGPGFPATVDILRYDDDAPWPVRPDGLGYSLELIDPSADLDNDPPEAWRTSRRLGGSPGSLGRPGEDVRHFTRAYCNGDAAIDLGDAITLLAYIFADGWEPPCLAGCDVTGDELLGIDDAVALLMFLFTAEGYAIPSPAPPQCLPAPEGFCEISNCSP